MKWKQELLWVKRNEHGVALRVEEERPPGVPADQFEDEEEVGLVNTSTEKFAIFASLNRYFELIQIIRPTLQQAEEAIILLCQLYGASDEDDLLERGEPQLIETYTELKSKILQVAI
ncbi:hypothetical protein PAECIP111891_02160 [Paenibacillus allorhizoplanae]|uniref:KIF-binding protein n=1 Tax=Paenibacillus allorhizoplanae TaxID=2905648 RepID=A0ABN8G8Q9_9BACL|nr:hypothetical protein [Paenibacillus allorhizoplanae]CAH1202950.1 hypothetical protein PAECIP111891_02160 [Paenibacillus allorhizoplanae]